jgi:hydroxypyruvate reductase
MAADDPRGRLAQVFFEVAARIDGQRLVADAVAADRAFADATDVLAVGKVALPMLRGLQARGPDAAPRILAVVPAAAGAQPGVPPTLPWPVELMVADHPHPTARSVAAAQAARAFVRTVGAGAGTPAHLLVLLSGGASSLLCAPADGLAWEDKRDAVAAVARAGATIRELNIVRKHLSAIKGGRLALETAAPIAVRALSDVIGDDPATIGSGPFSGDPSRYSEALAIVGRLGAELPAPARAHLDRGARGEIADTPKPGAGALAHVGYRVLAGPARVVDEARAAIARADGTAGTLALDVEDTVEVHAAAIGARALSELGGRPATNGTAPRILVGNGEPRVVLPAAAGRGGRATHLALLVARELAELPDAARSRVAFLAAGTDDRDGNTDVSGALVDGTTWERARARGLDPAAALRAFDSSPVLAAIGDTLRGPGTSNLLDLHLLYLP